MFGKRTFKTYDNLSSFFDVAFINMCFVFLRQIMQNNNTELKLWVVVVGVVAEETQIHAPHTTTEKNLPRKTPARSV